MEKTIITLTGPSCSGKTTLINLLMATGEYTEIISTTTRPKRVGEIVDKTYHFVTSEEFDKLEMLEQVEYNGNTYGGSVAEFEEKFASGKTPVIIVEPNGMIQINLNAVEKGWNVLNVWLGCPKLLQAERFLSRFVEEYKMLIPQGSNDDYAAFMKEYTVRMVTIQVTEAPWKEMFNENRDWRQSIVIKAFMKSIEDALITRIKEYVEEAKNKS